MKELITICGDCCDVCPRYTAKSEEELEAVARLWYRVGWRDTIVTKDEIKCTGCSSHKECTYQLVSCVKDHQVDKCNQCVEFPCNKIHIMLDKTKKSQELCKSLCMPEEFNILSKAFFEKEINLMK